MVKPLLVLFLKGLLIGLANLVPGVTLATSAMLLGSYRSSLQALQGLNLEALKLTYQKRFRELSGHLHWKLLLMFPLGACIAFFLLPNFLPLTHFITLYQPALYAFFCGMILCGMVFALAGHRGAGFIGFLLFFVGIALSTLPMLLPVQPLPVGWQTQWLTGLVGTLGALIPAIPETFTHKLVNNYEALRYYQDHDYWPASALFYIGVVLGIILIVTLFAFLFRRAQEQTLALLLGMMAGVLLQLWPLRFIQDNSTPEMSLLGIGLLCGIVFSGLLQFFQRRTLA